MDALLQDLRYSLRTLRKSPGFSLAAVSILTMGIGASVAVFTLLNAYLIRPLPYPEAGRVAAVIPAASRTDFNVPEGLARADWSELGPVFESVAAWDLDGFTVVDGERSDYVDGAWVTPGFFGVVGARLTTGRVFDSTEAAVGARVAVISHGFWQRHFAGSRDVLGKTIRAYSTDRPFDPDLFTVIGVLPDDFWHVSRFTNILVPLSTARTPSLVRLRPGVSLEEANRRLNEVIQPQLPNAAPGWRMTLSSLQEEYSLEARPAVLALLGASGVLLLIACVNVAGLLLLRGAERAREWIMRAAVGAGRARLLLSAALEGVVLTGIAGALGVALADQALTSFAPAIERQMGVGLPGGAGALALDWRVVGFSLALTLLLGGGLGIRFGLVAAGRDLAAALRATGARSGGVRGAASRRRTLVVTQVALSFALLVGAGLMLRTAARINAVDLGFRPETVIKSHVLLPRARYADGTSRLRILEQVQERVSRLPGVEEVAWGFPHPFRGDGAGTTFLAENAAADSGRAVSHTVTPGYLDALSVPLLEGRPFTDQDRAGAVRVALVSRSVADQMWPGRSAVGRRVRLGGDSTWRVVVGVTGDVRKTITGERFGDIYEPYAQNPRAYMGMMVRTNDLAGVMTVLPRAVLEVASDLPLSEMEPLGDVIRRAGSRQRFLSQLIGGAAGFAVILSLAGMYGVLAAVVAQRRRELAVRVAVGASRRDVVGLVVREATVLAGWGITVGIAVSVAGGRGLRSQLFGVSAGDPLTYLVAGLLFALVAMAAAVGPARRAAGLDPAAVLRSE